MQARMPAPEGSTLRGASPPGDGVRYEGSAFIISAVSCAPLDTGLRRYDGDADCWPNHQYPLGLCPVDVAKTQHPTAIVVKIPKLSCIAVLRFGILNPASRKGSSRTLPAFCLLRTV